MTYRIYNESILDYAARYAGPRYHGLLCDTPYELGFMGRDWDKTGIAFNPATWAALNPLLHPGAFGMAFASSRGWHRMAVAIEDAGFIIHPTIFCWTFGSGFPKATRIDTQVDRAAGAERVVVGEQAHKRKFAVDELAGQKPNGYNSPDRLTFELTAPATELAQAWEGHRYGLQAMKPAIEPIIVFQKPYQGRPVDCITRTGAGALNIEAARIPTDGRPNVETLGNRESLGIYSSGFQGSRADGDTDLGRWPANFVAVHTPWCDDAACADGCPVASLDAQSGILASGEKKAGQPRTATIGATGLDGSAVLNDYPGSEGGASRFFHTPDWNSEVAEGLLSRDPVRYVAKASQAERESGLGGDGDSRRNTHPTIKPIALNRWLASLLLPPAYYAPARRLLVPFSGAGSEMIGALHAGWDHIDGVELESEYATLAEQRLRYWSGAAIPAPIKRTAAPTGQISMLEAA